MPTISVLVFFFFVVVFFVLFCFRKSVWLTPVSTENEIKLDPSPFIADFETTPEELGLLSLSQMGFLLKEE